MSNLAINLPSELCRIPARMPVYKATYRYNPTSYKTLNIKPIEEPKGIAVSDEANCVREYAEDFLSSINYIELWEKIINPNASIIKAMKDSSGYATPSYLAHMTRLEIEDIIVAIKSSNSFCKSFMSTNAGEPIYYLKKPFGRLLDFWKTFQYLCTVKY